MGHFPHVLTPQLQRDPQAALDTPSLQDAWHSIRWESWRGWSSLLWD